MNFLWAVFGVLLGVLAIGCGPTQPSTGAGGSKTAPSVETEKQPAARANEKAKDVVFPKPEDLFAGMPKESYPLVGKDKGIERNEARKWCEANVVGKTLEWTAIVGKPSVSDKDPYDVSFVTKTRRINAYAGNGQFYGTSFLLGSEKCVVILSCRADYDENSLTIGYQYTRCTAEEAKALRGLEGKVTLRAKVTEAKVGSYSYSEAGSSKEINAVFLTVETPSINGILPKGMVQQRGW